MNLAIFGTRVVSHRGGNPPLHLNKLLNVYQKKYVYKTEEKKRETVWNVCVMTSPL